MDLSQIRIDQVRVKDLCAFAEEEIQKHDSDGIIPITPQRALAHQNNPHASEEDVGLLAAYSGHQCIGYLGILPGLLRSGNQLDKVHWFSTWYVPRQFRNTSVGLLLLKRALSLKYDIVVTGISKDAVKNIRSFGLPCSRASRLFLLESTKRC